MEKELIFIGYKDFVSKKNNKHYNMLDFITEPVVSQDRTRADCEKITIFVEDDSKYAEFLKEHSLLSKVVVNVTINGTNVRYSI